MENFTELVQSNTMPIRFPTLKRERDPCTVSNLDIEQFIKAVCIGDLKEIDNLIVKGVTIYSFYNSRCGIQTCQCICKNSGLESLKRGASYTTVIEHLVNTKNIRNRDLIEILVSCLKTSGMYRTNLDEIENKAYLIMFIVEYLRLVDPVMLINYSDPEGYTLLHLVYTGFATIKSKQEWFQCLVKAGCNPIARSKSRIICKRFITGKSILNACVNALDVEGVKCCLEKGADPNYYETNSYDRNLLLGILYDYRHLKDPALINKLCVISELLIKANINLGHNDINRLNVHDYVIIFGWKQALVENTECNTVMNIYSLQLKYDYITVNKLIIHKLFNNLYVNGNDVYISGHPLNGLFVEYQYIKTHDEIQTFFELVKQRVECQIGMLKNCKFQSENFRKILEHYGWKGTPLMIYLNDNLIC